MNAANEALALLRGQHESALFSGPEAIKMMLTVRPSGASGEALRTIGAYHPGMEGTSIVEVRALAGGAGLPLEIWKAQAVDRFPVPSIVHLRSQHFSAIVDYKDEKYQLRDPALGGNVWMRAEALREESTGFVLVASAPAGGEWNRATDLETAGIVGHCQMGKPSNDRPPCPTCGCVVYRNSCRGLA